MHDCHALRHSRGQHTRHAQPGRHQHPLPTAHTSRRRSSYMQQAAVALTSRQQRRCTLSRTLLARLSDEGYHRWKAQAVCTAWHGVAGRPRSPCRRRRVLGRALAACQPYRVSEYFPIIVIIMLCEKSRRIRVSRIRCYSFAPARSPEWREERVTSGASWFLYLV